MRRVSSREGLDWRLLAAIAYGESRFNPDLVSRMGAKGLMQIMPATAKQFNVPPEYIFNPEVNITLATKLLGKIESMLRLPRGIAFDDRMSIILACYNCGIGHVLDARRLAGKYDADPNSWDDVAHFLSLKADPAYHSDEVVKCGTFRGGGTTTAFVNTVMKKYDAYRTKTEEASPLL